MKVAIGSRNPVKIECVKQAFELVWPEESWEFVGSEVVSGVSDQPMSDEESILGATNRAQRACSLEVADYGVGLEGGLQYVGGIWVDCGWAVVVNKQGTKGVGSSVKMEIPPKMVTLIQSGIELGKVTDMVFKTDNAKHKNGFFGLMTNDLITRTSGFRDGVIVALVKFIRPEVF